MILKRREKKNKKQKTYCNNRLITVVPFSSKLDVAIKLPDRFLWNFPYLKLGIWDFEEKLGRDLGNKNIQVRGGMSKIAIRITGLNLNLGRDT